MSETVKIFALGGLNENGKSLYVVDYNNQLYIFDFGLRYPEEALLGIDVILPGYQYLVSKRNQIRGFFLTHGHDENMGALPFIIEELGEVDIYGTSFTLHSLLGAAERFHKKVNGAKFHVVGENQSFVVNGMTFHTFSVTHGAPYSCGYAMETDHGMIVYPGDFIIDINEPEPYNTNLNRLMQLSQKPTLALLAESYNADYLGFVSPKNHLSYAMNKISGDLKGRIVFAFYGQTVFQLQEILTLAMKARRKVLLYTKQARDMVDLLKKEKCFNFPDTLFTRNIFEKDCVIVVSELGNKVFEQLEKIASANDTNNSIRLNSEDAFVIACAPHSGTELSFARILDTLYKTGSQVFNITKEYVSMHAGSEDLKTMISIFKPKYYLPVRGYYNKQIANAKIALSMGYTHNNILVYDNGMVATFEDGQLVRSFEDVHADEVMVDGIGIGDVGAVVINDRRKLQQDGVVVCSVSFSMQTRNIVFGPVVEVRGVALSTNEKAFKEKVAKCFSETVFDFVQRPGLVDFNELRTLCKERITTLVRNDFEKDPMVLSVIISV